MNYNIFLKRKKLIVLGIIMSLTTVLIVIFNYHSNNDLIFPGVSICGIDVSYLTIQEAEAKVSATADFFENTKISIKDDNDKFIYDISPVEMGFAIDIKKTVMNAFKIGKKYNKTKNAWVRNGILNKSVNLPFQISENIKKTDFIISDISDKIFVKPKEAELIVTDNNTVSISESKEGIMLNNETTKTLIKNAMVEKTDRTVYIKTQTVLPSVRTDDIKKMGIKKLLSTFTTEFDISKTNRVDNIKLACNILNGYIIKPGEIFSFNNVIGPRTAENGFKLADIIINSELVPGIGGGICQLSTTLYNAALLANLEILSRKNHGIPVSYIQLGLDATVAYPDIDLKFKNTTNSCILIHAKIEDNHLTVNLYGDCEKEFFVEIISKVIEKIDPKTIIECTDLLDFGEQEIIKSGSAGYKVETYRVIKMGDAEIKREFLFLDNYIPKDRIIREGKNI